MLSTMQTDDSKGDLRPSIVVCVYNGRSRIGDVLDALAAQRSAPGSFALVVVDNNSTDGTTEYVRSHPSTADISSHGNEFKLLAESRQGLMFARLAGLLAAPTDVVCFLDDDNIPDPDYVDHGARFFEEHNGVGVVVSSVRPQFEEPPSPAIRRRQSIFAVNYEYMGSTIVEFASSVLAPTIGAGLWVRKSAFLAAVPWEHPERLIPDRIGNNMLSGNDMEIGILVGRAGYRRFYLPALNLTHKIPKGRLGTRYFTRLIVGVARSQATLDEVYEIRRRSPARRLRVAAELLAAVLLAPAVAVIRRDGLRDAWFAVVRRYAQFRGPYGKIVARMRGYP
jgi:glycosyltransferase involved in cell wall biosynthesis